MRRTYAEQQRRAQAVADHVEAYGYWCLGVPCLTAPCTAYADPNRNPLTADHLNPPGLGYPEDGPLRVLCRSCNAKLGAQLGRR